MRVQTPFLTEGHHTLTDYASFHSDQLIIILGIAPTMLATDNPLIYDMRKTMVEISYPSAIVLSVKDTTDDLIWSNEVDKVLLPYNNEDITIYGGRDSFIPYYLGNYKTFDIGKTPFDHINATLYRNKLKDYKYFQELSNNMMTSFTSFEDIVEFGFRCGVIWASQNKFPVAFATVDIGVVRENNGVAEILLGKKYKQNVRVLMGGFVDKEDSNYLSAAKRELREEIEGIKTSELKFIDSFKIDDWRYRKTADCIITNLHICKWIEGEPKGADDLETAEFYTFEKAYSVIGDHHKHLLNVIENNLELVGIKIIN